MTRVRQGYVAVYDSYVALSNPMFMYVPGKGSWTGLNKVLDVYRSKKKHKKYKLLKIQMSTKNHISAIHIRN